LHIISYMLHSLNIFGSFFQQKNIGFMVQNDEEIKADVNHCIQFGWLKWRRASSDFCDTNMSFKLK